MFDLQIIYATFDFVK